LYKAFQTSHFKKCFSDLVARDAQLKSQLENRMREMTESKISDFKPLKAKALRGWFSTRVGVYRILYAYCEDCKRCGFVSFNKCMNCKLDDGVLIFFDVKHRSKVYEM